MILYFSTQLLTILVKFILDFENFLQCLVLSEGKAFDSIYMRIYCTQQVANKIKGVTKRRTSEK